MITILHDTFSGVTSGVTIAGRVPSPTQNGSDVWADFSGIGFGAIGGASGGGVTSLDLGSSNAFAAYDLTGAPTSQTATFKVKASQASIATVHVELGRGAGGNHQVLLDYGSNEVRYVRHDTGDTTLATESFTFTVGTIYTVVAALTDTTITISIDGTPIIDGQAIIPTGDTAFLIGQSSGNITDIVFTEVKIEVADTDPTTATLSGPTTGTAGSPSTNFTVTLDQPAPSGGTAVALASSSGGTAFAGTGVSGTTLTIAEGSTSGTFTYTRAAGTSSISITSAGLTISGSPISYDAVTVITVVLDSQSVRTSRGR